MKYSAYYIQESEGNFSASIAELDLIKPRAGVCADSSFSLIS